MTRFLEAAGVDAAQWKALTRVFIRADFGPSLGALGRGQAIRANAALGLMALFYGMTGFGVGLIAASTLDRFLGGTIVVSYVAFLVSSTMLATHAGTIISPDDYAILGYRPITSRTYLAVRVATILAHTTLTATLIGFMPVVVFVVSFGPRVGFALMAAILMTSVSVTLAILTGYAWLLTFAGPARLGRLVSYAQLVSSSVVYLGIATVSGSAVRHVLSGVGMPTTAWVLVYPGTWFGSYVALGAGRFEPALFAGAALSLLCVGSIVWSLGGKLSLSYSERLASLATLAAARRTSEPTGRWRLPFFRRDEPRAIALLIRTQFKHDNRFRMAVLTFVPLTAFYLYLGARDGPVADPFVASSRGSSQVVLLQLVLYFLPMSLKGMITASDAYRASWIFHAAPADRTRLVVAARNAITAYVVIPYLACLGVYYAWAFHNIAHALVHVVCLGLMSEIVFEAIVLIDPRLPFSEPANRARQSSGVIGGMMVLMVVGLVFYNLVTVLVYPYPTLVATMIVVFVVAVWALDRLTRLRIARTVDDQTYLE